MWAQPVVEWLSLLSIEDNAEKVVDWPFRARSLELSAHLHKTRCIKPFAAKAA